MVQGKSYKIEIIDRDSESNSNTAATAAQELIANEGVNVMLVAQTPGHHRARRAAGDEQRDPGALEQRAMAAALPRDRRRARAGHRAAAWPRNGTTTSSGASRTSSRCSPDMWNEVKAGAVVGGALAGRPGRQRMERSQRRVPAGVGGGGVHRGRPRSVPARRQRLLGPDQRLQGRRSRDRHRRAAAAGLRQLLGPGAAAGPEARRRSPSARRSCSRAPSPRTRTRSGCRRRSGGRTSTRPPPASRARPRPTSLAPTRRRRTSSGPSPSATSTRCSRCSSTPSSGPAGVEDKQALLDAIGETTLPTIAGTVDFTKPVVPHITKTPLVGGQWVESDKWDVEFKIVTNTQFPEIPMEGTLQRWPLSDTWAPRRLRRPNIELYSDDALADPYPRYEELRGTRRAVWLEAYGLFALSRFAECKRGAAELAGLLVRAGRDDERPHERDARRHRAVCGRRGARSDAQGDRRSADPAGAGRRARRDHGGGRAAGRAAGGPGHLRCRHGARPPPPRHHRVSDSSAFRRTAGSTCSTGPTPTSTASDR